jgi:hypothetical protein
MRGSRESKDGYFKLPAVTMGQLEAASDKLD